MLSYETLEILKNIYFEEYLWTTASKNQFVTKKLFIGYFHKFMNFIIITITLKFLVFLCGFC